jgi:hypothetical protein
VVLARRGSDGVLVRPEIGTRQFVRADGALRARTWYLWGSECTRNESIPKPAAAPRAVRRRGTEVARSAIGSSGAREYCELVACAVVDATYHESTVALASGLQLTSPER